MQRCCIENADVVNCCDILEFFLTVSEATDAVLELLMMRACERPTKSLKPAMRPKKNRLIRDPENNSAGNCDYRSLVSDCGLGRRM